MDVIVARGADTMAAAARTGSDCIRRNNHVLPVAAHRNGRLDSGGVGAST